MAAINIILDEGDGRTPDVLFVEIELDNGHSINIGKRSKYGNFTKLRITTDEIFFISRSKGGGEGDG